MKYLTLFSLLITTLLTGCVSNNQYYWANYESTLYSYSNEPTNANMNKHKIELEKIITNAARKKKSIPPGIYFELGMIEAKLNNKEQAVKFLNLEKNTYSEATLYVNNVLKVLEKKS